MGDQKIVFVTCEEGDQGEVGKVLGSIPENVSYFFFITTKKTGVMTRQDIVEYHRMLGEVLERTGTPVTRRPLDWQRDTGAGWGPEGNVPK